MLKWDLLKKKSTDPLLINKWEIIIMVEVLQVASLY